MSFNKINSLFDELQDAVNDCQADVTKFVEEITPLERGLEKPCKLLKLWLKKLELKFKIKRTNNSSIILLNE